MGIFALAIETTRGKVFFEPLQGLVFREAQTKMPGIRSNYLRLPGLRFKLVLFHISKVHRALAPTAIVCFPRILKYQVTKLLVVSITMQCDVYCILR